VLSIQRRAVAVDMHADTVQFVIDEGADISRRADAQVEAVRALAERHPDIWTFATTAADIRRAHDEGKLAALLGLEGGYAIDEQLERVEHYFERGVRYMTPAWTHSLSWAGSSGDAEGATRGLDDFGREVIREMNRLGMLVDVSHVSDKTFWDMSEASTSPIIATHSNCRALADVPRNLTDDMIRAIAETGGVVCVVFYPGFLEPGWKARKDAVEAEVMPLIEEARRSAAGPGSSGRIAADRVREREFAARLAPVPFTRVADHIDHIVRLTGVEHVGCGSDFDGITATPAGLSSVAELPNLTAELLRRGYTVEDVSKILGGNVLRVMEEVERRAAR
jgi:membrane dipeptidase